MLSRAIGLLSVPLQRVIALLALAILAAVIWYGFVNPVRAAIDAQTGWHRQIRRQISTDRAWVQGGRQVRQQQQIVEQAVDWRRFYPPQTTADLADHVTRDVTALMSAAGASVEHTEALAVEPEEGLQRGAVRIAASLSIDQLKGMLANLQAHQPYLRLAQLHVTAPQSQPQGVNAMLLATVDVYGYSGRLDPAIAAP